MVNFIGHGFLGDLALLAAADLALWLWVCLVPTAVIRVRRLHLGALGLALPGLVMLDRGCASERILRHELAHQRQMRRYTPLGVALALGWHYGWGFIRRRRLNREVFWDLWRTNPLELEAIEAMDLTRPLPRLLGWTPSD